ncbi:MFS transporter [Caldibacillus thermoamylovorans]|uniref:MFS transporter n=1 Tax=Caldibacillus thermoamylovorans TaxID=35841 RepID=UPI0022858F7C|nr:MFS transporter [Caldibacillus thermoamylovorans]
MESFLSTAISNMIFPFMAIYLSNHFGVKITGILLLVNVFIGIALSFFGGYVSDRFGRKKLIVFAEMLRFFAFTVMMICNSPWFTSPLITYFMMTINTICWSLGGPANQAMLIDVSKPDERKYMFSIMYWANNLSIAIGGSLGGFLFKDYLFELLIALSITALITVILIVFFIDESYVPEQVADEKVFQHICQMLRNYREVFRDHLFILYCMAIVFVMSLEFQLSNYVGIRLESEMPVQRFLWWELDGIEMTGLLRTENTVLVVLMALFAAKMVSRFKDRHVIILGSFVFVAGYAYISYSNNIPFLFIAMLLASVAEVVRVPVEQNYQASLPPVHARSSYLAVSGMGYNLAQLICSITVMISAYLNNLATTVFIAAIGFFGVFIFMKIGSALDKRVNKSAA